MQEGLLNLLENSLLVLTERMFLFCFKWSKGVLETNQIKIEYKTQMDSILDLVSYSFAPIDGDKPLMRNPFSQALS